MNLTKWACSLTAVMLLGATVSAQASTIEIQIIDVDATYNSGTGEIADAGATSDPISALFFFVDGNQVGNLQNPPDLLSLDLSIPGVFGISSAGGTTFSADGGSLELLTPSSILDLDLEVAQIDYLPISGSLRFVFVGTVGDIVSQDLPFGLELGAPVSVTFSMQAANVVTSAGEVVSFTASGTGELEGALIPEPTSIAMLAVLASAGLVRRRIR